MLARLLVTGLDAALSAVGLWRDLCREWEIHRQRHGK